MMLNTISAAESGYIQVICGWFDSVYVHVTCMCMYIYIYILCRNHQEPLSTCDCIYIYIYIYVHTYIRTYVHTYIRTYVHTYIHIYACVCVYLHFIMFNMYKFRDMHMASKCWSIPGVGSLAFPKAAPAGSAESSAIGSPRPSRAPVLPFGKPW